MESEQNVIAFTDKVAERAQQNYEKALSRNQLLQIVLFLVCFPTLLYTAYYTGKTFHLANLLSKAETDRNKFLTEQNTSLENRVATGTEKIAAQNKEILSQSEELAAQHEALAFQNKQLFEAQKIIELQNLEIHWL